MTGKEFLNAVAGGRTDVLQAFLDAVRAAGADYCVVGGLAVNAYAEPVVSLDLDVVLVASRVDEICAVLAGRFTVERFPHSLNLTCEESELRIQLQTDPRYQDFLPRAEPKKVLGYDMRVASAEDVIRGKAWAFQDAGRRPSKRQKDLADIMRLVEVIPSLSAALPPDIKARLG